MSYHCLSYFLDKTNCFATANSGRDGRDGRDGAKGDRGQPGKMGPQGPPGVKGENEKNTNLCSVSKNICIGYGKASISLTIATRKMRNACMHDLY